VPKGIIIRIKLVRKMGVLHVWGDGAPLGGEGASGGSIFMCAYEKSDELSFATNFRPLGGIGEK
jgi:hypothetical protein